MVPGLASFTETRIARQEVKGKSRELAMNHTPNAVRACSIKPVVSTRAAFVMASLAFLFMSLPVRADVGVVLGETLDLGAERITGSGHSAVYLSRICPASPVKMRLCLPGENGSVLSSYQSLDEDQPFEWNIAPLNVFVYGVENPQNRPLFATASLKNLLEDNYRRKYLAAICTNNDCINNRDANWRYMVGATFERGLYVFVIRTTLEQDIELINRFNSHANISHFNGVTQNCADFTRTVVNSYFPGATHRDLLNDFGMTSPKAVARSFTKYAERHPEAEYRVYHFPQMPGTIKRSTEVRAGTEQLYRSKKWLVPMLIVANHELPFFAASYLITGRFNPQREAEQHPTIEATQIRYELAAAKSGNDDDRVEQLKTRHVSEIERGVGTPEQWKKYREEFRGVVNDAIRSEIIANEAAIDRFFKFLDQSGRPMLDRDGALWMNLPATADTPAMRLGISANNVFTPDSDSRLAYALILAHVRGELKSPPHSRESMPEFTAVWSLLLSAQERNATTPIDGRRAQERAVPEPPTSREPVSDKVSAIQRGDD